MKYMRGIHYFRKSHREKLRDRKNQGKNVALSRFSHGYL